MNRFISSAVFALVTGAVMGGTGHFQARGFVAIGDMRIPSNVVALAAIALAGVAGLIGGGGISWSPILAKLKSMLAVEQPSVPSPTVDDKKDTQILNTPIDFVPEDVVHMQRCVYHLRRLMCDDEEAKNLIDQIAVKTGRITADIPQNTKVTGVLR